MKNLSLFNINLQVQFKICYFAKFYDLEPADTKIKTLSI